MTRQTVLVCMIMTLMFGTAASAQPSEQADVRALIEGPAWPRYSDLVATYDASVTPELIELLESGTDEAHWVRAAGMLGTVGDERAAPALIAFIERPGVQPISIPHDEARKEAIRALGILVQRTGHEPALSYLIESLTPRVWRTRNVQGMPSSVTSYTDYDLELSKFALFGLALTGHPQAAEAISSLQSSPTRDQLQLRTALGDVPEQWFEVHGLVAERGLAGMYEHYETQRRNAAEQRLQEIEREQGPEAAQGLRESQ